MRERWSDQYGIPCVSVESPDFANADALIAMCETIGAVRTVDGIEFCAELRDDVGPELWTEESLRRSVGKKLSERNPNMPCPRMEGREEFVFQNMPDDGTCTQCGSLLPDEFMRRLEAGDVALDPTDKSYKVYVINVGGAKFRQSHRTDKPSQPGEIMKDPRDQSHWTWETNESDQCKFYFDHLSEDQKKRFVELYNDKKLKIRRYNRDAEGGFSFDGHFYVRPFFCVAAG